MSEVGNANDSMDKSDPKNMQELIDYVSSRSSTEVVRRRRIFGSGEPLPSGILTIIIPL